MIGRFRWHPGSSAFTATLGDDLAWRVEDAHGARVMGAEAYLDVVHPAAADSPAAGSPGSRAFHAAARDLDAAVLVPPRASTAPAGTVF